MKFSECFHFAGFQNATFICTFPKIFLKFIVLPSLLQILFFFYLLFTERPLLWEMQVNTRISLNVLIRKKQEKIKLEKKVTR